MQVLETISVGKMQKKKKNLVVDFATLKVLDRTVDPGEVLCRSWRQIFGEEVKEKNLVVLF